MFSANKNQQPGEIARVASGGEISRVMLALKYVLSGAKQLPVIILDEIDTGLSGEVAHRMSLIMREMAGRMQVISISHLPQIAAAAIVILKYIKKIAVNDDFWNQEIDTRGTGTGDCRHDQRAGNYTGSHRNS